MNNFVTVLVTVVTARRFFAVTNLTPILRAFNSLVTVSQCHGYHIATVLFFSFHFIFFSTYRRFSCDTVTKSLKLPFYEGFLCHTSIKSTVTRAVTRLDRW